MSSGLTKTKTIIGIDYSLTSPAVCIDGKKYYYLTNKKKWLGKISEDIIGYEHKEWTDPIQRFTYISDFVFDCIGSLVNPKIFIEGYSFGSKGQGLFQIAENCGIPTPATIRVVQIVPGPIPTLTASAPASMRALAPSAVAMLPAKTSV